MKTIILILILFCFTKISFSQSVFYNRDTTGTYWLKVTFPTSAHNFIISNDSKTDTLYIPTDSTAIQISSLYPGETITFLYTYVNPSPPIFYFKSKGSPIIFRIWAY